jgi:T-complex protein 1 subunit zeta
VLDHGGRHPDMPKKLTNCYILTCNISLEYEKTEVNSSFFFSNAEDRQKLADSERKFTDERCQKIIDLKRKLCTGNDKSFVLINEKGIDPISLEALAKENIIALRRAKRRNMERIVLACGGFSVNSVEDLSEADLGYADEVYEQGLGEEKYTFVEGVKHPRSCTILIKGPNEHTIAMIKDAVRDGLRAVKNVYDDKCVVPGAGSFEVAANIHLNEYCKTVEGKAKLGIQAFAESLLVVPKVLAENSGYDIQEAIILLKDEYYKNKVAVGINLNTLGTISPIKEQIYDNYCAKKNWLNIAPTLAQQLLLVDEIMRAGKGMGRSGPSGATEE